MKPNDPNLQLAAGLDISKSKSQLNKDIQTIKKQLDDFRLTTQLNPDQIQLLEKQLNTLQINLTDISISPDALNKMVSQINDSLKEITISNLYLGSIGNHSKKDSLLGLDSLKNLGDKVKSLYTSLSESFIGSKIFLAIKNGVKSVTELDTALIELKKASGMTAGQLKEFYFHANDTAKQMGVTTKEILEQATAWSLLGFSSAEAAAKMAKYSAMFQMISPDMDLNSASKGLASIMNAFQIGLEDSEEVVDGIMSKINIISSTQHLSNGSILDFLIPSSGAMAEANNSLEETIALGAAAMATTGDAASAGNALKNISMHLRGLGEETNSYANDIHKLSDTISSLTRTPSTPGGISLFSDEAETELKSTKEVFDEIAAIYKNLTANNQASLLDALAGNGQDQVIGSIFNNYQVVEASMKSMANSAGNAEKEISAAMESIDYKLHQVKETGTGIAQNLFKQEDLNSVISILLSFLETIDHVTEKLGLFGTIMAGAGGFGVINFVKNLDYQKVLKKFPRFLSGLT